MIQKFILIIIFFLFSNYNANAKNFKWSDKIESEDGYTEFYFDKNSIKKIDNYAEDMLQSVRMLLVLLRRIKITNLLYLPFITNFFV